MRIRATISWVVYGHQIIYALWFGDAHISVVCRNRMVGNGLVLGVFFFFLFSILPFWCWIVTHFALYPEMCYLNDECLHEQKKAEIVFGRIVDLLFARLDVVVIRVSLW